MPNWKLTIAYDGTNYHGWQIQPDVRTVQGELNRRLRELFAMEIQTVGASRTDAGVHSIGQVMSVELPERFSCDDLERRLNLMLPNDISIRNIEIVPDGFSARYSAAGKRYEYRIIFEKDPHLRHAALWLHNKPNLKVLNDLAKYVLGEHDFSAFARLQSLPESPICKISRTEWVESERGTDFVIEGNRFLHTMVRSLVGAMLDCERGRFSPGQFAEMIETGERKYDYKVADAKGLWLVDVFYDRPQKRE